MSRESQRNRRDLRHLDARTTVTISAWLVRPSRGRPPANNYVRQRLSTIRGYLRWLDRLGHAVPDISELDAQVRRSWPKVYGKRQSANPARFLTYNEAFGRLIPACADGTWVGSRDELVIRLGLCGLRRAEIIVLCWRNWQQGVICCTGKGRRVREVYPGPVLADLLARWHQQYCRAIGRLALPDEPIICGQAFTHAGPNTTRRDINWGHAVTPQAVETLVRARGRAAGLGHMSPHDLRRSAASILHHAKTPDGGHLYDLLDIQRVLDHVDPATTQRSYLDHLDTAVKERAGRTLD